MKEGLEKFRKLLLTDQDFQNKLKEASMNYTGEQTEEAIFNSVLVPLAAEYNITATYDEFMEYSSNLSNQELSSDELSMVAGGKPDGGGFGMTQCTGAGGGLGAAGSSAGGGVCVFTGLGWGDPACFTVGYSG